MDHARTRTALVWNLEHHHEFLPALKLDVSLEQNTHSRLTQHLKAALT